MRRFAAIFVATLASLLPVSQPLLSQAANSTTERELTAMLTQFLNDAGTNNPAGFDRFFADDLIYTRSAGATTTKADIMRSLNSPRAENASAAPASKSTFSAEDITIHPYGDTAVVAFRLVGRTEHPDGKVEIANYRNTGTFLRRNGKWQVVAWQSTKMPDAVGGTSASANNASEISAISTLWAREWTARHPDTVLALYADDAVFHAPDHGRIAGRAAINDLFRLMQSTVIPSITLHSTRSQIAGNLAYDSGEFQETLTMKADNSTRQYHGTYLMVFRREAGKWLIIEHMWNDLSAPAAQ
jgi:ketosteroid isomerase-like protein